MIVFQFVLRHGTTCKELVPAGIRRVHTDMCTSESPIIIISWNNDCNSQPLHQILIQPTNSTTGECTLLCWRRETATSQNCRAALKPWSNAHVAAEEWCFLVTLWYLYLSLSLSPSSRSLILTLTTHTHNRETGEFSSLSVVRQTKD